MLSTTVVEVLTDYRDEGARLLKTLSERQKLLRAPCGQYRIAGRAEDAEELEPVIETLNDLVLSLEALLSAD